MESSVRIETKVQMCEMIGYICEINRSLRVKYRTYVRGWESGERGEWKSKMDRNLEASSSVAKTQCCFLFHTQLEMIREL